MGKLQAYLGIIRAPFLLLACTLVASGAAAAAYDGTFFWTRTLVALVGLVALHISVNALNEASDMRSGIDLWTRKTPFSGGSGTLPEGRLAERTAWIVGFGSFAAGAVCGGWFLYQVGWHLLPLFALGAVCVLAYTEVLSRTGIGEAAAGLGLGGLPVLGTALVQGGGLGPAAVAASVPAFLMTFNLLLLNEFPDETADRRGGRRNLVILLGRRGGAMIYAAAGLMVPFSLVISVLLGALPPLSLLAVLPSIMLVQPFRWTFSNPQRPVPVRALGANVRWNLATNAVLAGALTATVHMNQGWG